MRSLWPLVALMLACLALMLAQDWFALQEIGFRKRWAWVAGRMWFYPSAFHDDGFDWGWQRGVMLFTHGFWHLGWLHLGVNMGMLALFGVTAIRQAGAWRFLALYLAVMPLAALVYAWANGPEGSMAGASGAIHGVAGAVVVWTVRRGQPLHALVWVLLIVALNGWFWWLTAGRFALSLHLAGLAIGAVLAMVVRLRPLPGTI